MIAFQSRVAAGTVLVRSALQSPGFVHGSTGWTVNQDGSAEFNNLTLRGTFVGTNYVQNAAGEFWYSGTPAAGNLIGSMAAIGGTDPYGNQYPAGFNDQTSAANGAQFANINNGSIFLGQIAGGTQDTNNAAQIDTVPASALLAVQSGVTASKPSAGEIRLVGGASTVSTGNANTPKVGVLSGDLSSDCDLLVSGTVIKCNDASSLYTWQAPTLSSMTNNSLQYRRDALDNAVWDGEMTSTTTTAGAGSINVVVTANAVPAEYRPKNEPRPVFMLWLSSGGTPKGTAALTAQTDGTMTLFTTGAIAVGDRFYCSGGLVPLGNIA